MSKSQLKRIKTQKAPKWCTYPNCPCYDNVECPKPQPTKDLTKAK